MEKYSDIDIFLQKNELTGDVPFKIGTQCISQSLTNIALTKRGDRMFLPEFGTDLLETLQENLLQLEYNILKDVIIAEVWKHHRRPVIRLIHVWRPARRRDELHRRHDVQAARVGHGAGYSALTQVVPHPGDAGELLFFSGVFER